MYTFRTETWLAAALCALAASDPILAGTLHHQGVVAVQGERFTGQGLFRFALVDPATDAYLWTNDGSAVIHPDPPTSAATLTTINGVYNVLLGDASLTNMTAIPADVFAPNDDVVLRIWFDDNDEHGVHRLTPDLSIAPVPYAARASRCDAIGVPDSAELAVTVENGTTTVNGNLAVSGSFTNFSVVGPATVSRTTIGSSTVQLTETANSFCALTRETIDIDSFSIDTASCRIQVANEHWTLVAALTGGFTAQGQVICEARCFVFQGE